MEDIDIEKNPLQTLVLGSSLLGAQIFGLVGNTFVLIIGSRIFRHRKNVPNVLILMLGWCDFLTLPFAYPPTLMKYFLNIELTPSLCNYQGTALLFFYFISVTLVSLSCIDRFLAISKPFCYDTYITYDRETVKVGSIGLCGLGLTIGLLPTFGVGHNVVHYPEGFCLFSWTSSSVEGRSLVFVIMSLLSMCLCIVVFTSLGIFILTLRLIQNAPPADEESPKVDSSSSGQKRAEVQFAKLSMVVAVVFLLCWGLFLVRVCLLQAGYPADSFLDFLAVRLVSFHTVLNPWIYPLIRRQYREGFWYLTQMTLHYMTCTLYSMPSSSLEEIVGIRPPSKRASLASNTEETKRTSGHEVAHETDIQR